MRYAQGAVRISGKRKVLVVDREAARRFCGRLAMAAEPVVFSSGSSGRSRFWCSSRFQPGQLPLYFGLELLRCPLTNDSNLVSNPRTT